MKDMKKTAALLAAMALLGVGSASAAEAAPMYALKGITVTATRQAESLKDVPANVQVITEKDIKLRNVQTASDAVAMATGVSASNSVEGTVNLRGYSSKNILVLVDGQQMNTAWNGDVDWNMIPVENIRKIEVVSGGQSALYGGRAVGGVINIMTKSEKRDGVHGSAVVSYGSHATVKQAYAVHGKKDKLSWGTFYESKITNGWRDYNAYVTKSNGKKLSNAEALDRTADGGYVIGNRGNKHVLSENYGFNLGYAFNDDQKLTYKYMHSNYTWEYQNPETFTGKWTESTTTSTIYTPASFLGTKAWRTYDMHSLSYNDQKNKVHAHFGLVDYTTDAYTTPGTVDPAKNFDGTGKIYSYPSKSWDFDINKRWTLGAHTLLMGASYGQDQFDQEIYKVSDWKAKHSSRTGNIETHGGKDKTYALYIQDKWDISSKWTAYIGGRYDYYKKYGGYSQLLNRDGSLAEPSGFDGESFNQFSPKLSLDYKWDEDTNLYASYGRSFNAPILYQVYREGMSVHGSKKTHTLPNPALKPETTDTWEFGMKKKVAEKTEIHTDVFYAKTSDQINLIDTHTKDGDGYTIKQYMNSGEAKTHGFEISINQHHSDYWTSYANYTWQVGKIEGKRDWDIPRHLIHVGTTFHKDAWTVNLDGMFISNRYLATSDMNDTKYNYAADYQGGHFKARDAYFLLNLNTNYQFNKNFSMQFAIENVLDREYFDEDISTSHCYIGDGRTFTLSARYTF